RVAHVLGLADQRFTLGGKFVEQVADTNLVVVVGALERGHLVVHQRFQFGGARQRALHTVAHGGDLAADRLADRYDRFTRGAFGLRETYGDFGERLRDVAEILRAADQQRDHVSEDDRNDDGCGEAE